MNFEEWSKKHYKEQLRLGRGSISGEYATGCSNGFIAGRESMREQYDELLMAVARKFPNESRHETALRYIKEAENAEAACCSAAIKEIPL